MRNAPALLSLILAACANAESPAPAPAPPAVAVAAPMALESRSFVAQGGGLRVPIKIRVPARWVVRAERELVPPDEAEADGVALDFWATCDGDCTPDKLAARLRALVDDAPAKASRPNLNTGNAELDAVRLDVKTVEKGTLPGGGFVVYRVGKPAGVSGPYFEGLAALCARRKEGADTFVVATVMARADKEKTIGPVLLEACKTWEID
jgi:hypothetical protein